MTNRETVKRRDDLMLCTACSADVPDGDCFCENCGFKFAEPEPSPDACPCGAPVAEADEDGFCQRCGRRVQRPASDHMEVAMDRAFAAVSDRGLRHERNEDRFALVQEGGRCGLVLCDGVSATNHPEVASSTVSEVVAGALQRALGEGAAVSAEDVLVDAMASAAAELKDRRERASEGENAPSTTVVSALLLGEEVTVAWVGDSRAYWIDAEGAKLLTRDHSWMNMALDSGEMTREQAEAAPQAHAITRWIGADAEGAAADPEVVRHHVASDGTLLLCTDGLWNYVPEPERMADLIRGMSARGDEALMVAQALVAFAIEQGGRDNVTVAVLRVQRGMEASSGETGDALN